MPNFKYMLIFLIRALLFLRLMDLLKIVFNASSSETLKIIYEMIKVVLVYNYFIFLALIWASSWLFIMGSLLQYVRILYIRFFRESPYLNRPVIYRALTRRPPENKGDETARLRD